MNSSSPAERLLEWFLRERRLLPWREASTPYAVLVSEMMLQQTRVEVVIPYFLRWMATFPTIEKLAASEEGEVIKLWEGLGYYSRARNLRKAAQQVVALHGGELPACEGALRRLPGIGRYTASALLAFAFHRRKLALDGNAIRVVARWGYFSEKTGGEASLQQLEKIGEPLLCVEEPWRSSEALIELGALVCKPSRPHCGECPLVGSCIAYSKGDQEKLPQKQRSPAIEFLSHRVIVACNSEHIFLETGVKGRRFEGLYYFPFLKEEEVDGSLPFSEVASQYVGAPLRWQRRLPLFRHSFTRYQVELIPELFWSDSAGSVTESSSTGRWIGIEMVKKLSFVSGHRGILHEVLR